MNTSQHLVRLCFTFIYFVLCATLARGQQPLPARYYSASIEFDHLTTNQLLVKNHIGKEIPVRMAYWVPGKAHEYDDPLTDAEIQKLEWQPFKPVIMADLGSGTGSRNVWIVVEWQNPKEYQQEELGVTVETEMPSVVITYPTNRITSQPWLQLQGYCSGLMLNPGYDISNSTGTKLNQDALPTDNQGWDEKNSIGQDSVFKPLILNSLLAQTA